MAATRGAILTARHSETVDSRENPPWTWRQQEEQLMSDSSQARGEGFYWVVLGQNPPEIAYWERGE
jgi:hypothetical protein